MTKSLVLRLLAALCIMWAVLTVVGLFYAFPSRPHTILEWLLLPILVIVVETVCELAFRGFNFLRYGKWEAPPLTKEDYTRHGKFVKRLIIFAIIFVSSFLLVGLYGLLSSLEH